MTKPPKPPKQDPPEDALDLAPHSVDAEEALLGAILINPEMLSTARMILAPSVTLFGQKRTATEAEMFFIVRHGWIFDAMCEIVDRGDRLDIRSLVSELRQRDQLDGVGGAAYLNYLTTVVPSPLHADTYAQLVQRPFIRRQLLGAAGEIASIAQDETSDIDSVVERSEQIFHEAIADYRVQFIKSAGTLAGEFMDIVGEARLTGDSKIRIPTGLASLDDLLAGGVPRGLITLVGGRPGQGKTSLMLTIAVLAVRAGYRVLFFSLEMNEEQIAQRLASIDASIPTTVFEQPQHRMDDEAWKQLADSVARQESWPLLIDTSRNTMTSIFNKTQVIADRAGGIDLVFVDYAGLISLEPHMQRHSHSIFVVQQYLAHRFWEFTRDRRLRQPPAWVVAKQLSRNAERRADNQPELDDLRGAGEWEQNAYIVLLLHRPDTHDEETDRPGEMDIIVAKHRNGPTGVASMFYKAEFTRVDEIQRKPIDLSNI